MNKVLSPNQIVAYNLARVRGDRGLTQKQTCELLAPFLRSPWSVASLSAAERSIDGKRIKEFDADELMALSRAFELPLAFWFLPASAETVRIAVRGSEEGLAEAELLEVIFGRAEHRHQVLTEQLREARRALLHLDEILSRLDPNSSVRAVREEQVGTSRDQSTETRTKGIR